MEGFEPSRAGFGDLPTRPAPTPSTSPARRRRATSAECWGLRSLRIRGCARPRRPARQPGLGLLGARRQIDVGKAHADRVAPEERHGQRVTHTDICGNPFSLFTDEVRRQAVSASPSSPSGSAEAAAAAPRRMRAARPRSCGRPLLTPPGRPRAASAAGIVQATIR